MPGAPMVEPTIRCEQVSKILCGSIRASRFHAVRDILLGRRRGRGGLRRGEFHALRDISFSVGPRERLLILGTPGSGKTTLARTLLGILAPEEGQIEVAGSVQGVVPRKLGHFPLTRLREYLELVPLLYQCAAPRGTPAPGGGNIAAVLAEFCEVGPWLGSSVRDVPKEILNRIAFCAPLFLGADFHIFDGAWAIGSGPFRRKCQAKVLEVLDRSGAILLTGTSADLPPGFTRSLVLHQGKLVWEGPPEGAVPVFNGLLRAVADAAAAGAGAATGLPGPGTSAAGAASPGWTPAAAVPRSMGAEPVAGIPGDPVAGALGELERIHGGGRPIVMRKALRSPPRGRHMRGLLARPLMVLLARLTARLWNSREFKARAEQWKAAARSAEAVGGDPLKVWQEMQRKGTS